MANLAENLPADAKENPELAEAFRRLVKSVTVKPAEDGQWLISVEGRLSS